LSQFAHIDVLSVEQSNECNIENCVKIEISSCSGRSINAILNNFFFLFFPPVLVKFINFFKVFSIGVLGKKDIFFSKKAKELIKYNKYDFIFIRYIEALVVFGIKPSTNIIIDIDDLPEQVFLTNLNIEESNDLSLKNIYHKLYYYFAAKTSRHYTKKIVKNVFAVFFPNERQCSLFNNSFYLPNIPYPLNTLKTKQKAVYQILFVGLISHKPNYTGIEYFLNCIFPVILEQLPDVNFRIIGKIPEKIKNRWLIQYKNISILGFVNNLEDEYNNSSVVVIPVYHGSGTNIKVLEAMSYGKACVISSFAGKGFEKLLINEENILIAENDTDFADKTVRFLKDSELRKNIGTAAKKSINEQYSFENFYEIMKKTIILPETS
jgi:glycosyltransferase involved in cell wall biosynthesis